jgi:hypothetical protein
VPNAVQIFQFLMDAIGYDDQEEIADPGFFRQM